MPKFRKILGILLFFFPLWIYLLEHLTIKNYWGIAFLMGAVLYHFRANIKSHPGFCLGAVGALALLFTYLPALKVERLYPFSVSAAMLAFFIINHRKKEIAPLEKATRGFFRFLLANRSLMAQFGSILPKGTLAKLDNRKTDQLSEEETTILHSIMPIWIVGLSINTSILFLFLFFFPTSWWVYYSCGISYILLACVLLISITYGRKYHSPAL